MSDEKILALKNALNYAREALDLAHDHIRVSEQILRAEYGEDDIHAMTMRGWMLSYKECLNKFHGFNPHKILSTQVQSEEIKN